MTRTYNVLDEPWIPVKYLNGKKTKLGIIGVLREAEDIEDIISPTFRNDTVHIYYMGMIRLLTAVIEAAYYKEDTHYASKNLKYLDPLKEQGLYSDVIRNYLEKYHDRFDILSETHPFLQNINLKPELETLDPKDHKFLTWNLLIPSENNFVFGRTRKRIEGAASEDSVLSQYKISKEEFVHMLIYFATIGNVPASTVSNEGSLGKKFCIFAIVRGRNLKETILANILPLDESSRPLEDDETPDMPVWEMDNVHDIEKYDKDQLVHNLLCRAFYPGISVLGTGFDDNGYLTGMARVTKNTADKKYGIPSEIGNAVADVEADPFTIVSYGKDSKFTVSPFNPETDMAHRLCITATGHTDKWENCKVINNKKIAKDYTVQIYYRVMDGMKYTLLGCGTLPKCNGEIWEKLKDEACHMQAVKYQENYGGNNKVHSCLKASLTKILTGSSVICSLAEKELSDWMENDFFMVFPKDLENNVDSAALTATTRLSAEALRIFDKYSETSGAFLTVVKERQDLVSKLNKITGLKEKKNGRK